MSELALATNLESAGQVCFCGFLLLLEHVPLSSVLWSLLYCLKSFFLTQPFLAASTAVFSIAPRGNQASLCGSGGPGKSGGHLSFCTSLLQST